MIYNLLFLSVFTIFLVQGNGLDINESLQKLKQMTNDASRNVSSVADSIDNVRDRHNEMVKEKLTCLSDQYCIQKKGLNNTIIETTLKALSKDKQFPPFQCISAAGNEYLNAMTATFSKIPEESDRIKEKSVASVQAYALLIPGFYSFLNNLYSGSEEALRGSKTEDDLKEVLDEASKKIENLNTVLEQVDKKLNELKFAFFNEYVNFVYTIDKSFRKSAHEGRTKVTACLRK